MDSFHDEDFSASVAWETGAAPSSSSSPHAPAPDSSSAAQPYSAYTHDASPGQGGPDHTAGAFTEGGDAGGAGAAAGGAGPGRVHGQAVHDVQVRDGKVELEGTSDTFVSYLVTAKTDLPGYGSKTPSARRRFHDFVFLRDGLVKDFPASVVPPLPEKHRMEYVIGDRFSPEFIERRRVDLERFLQRLARHPKLSRTSIYQAFLESSEWNVYKHKHQAHVTAADDAPSGVLDSLSDTLLNAFAKLKKPDERFVVIRQHLDSFEEGLTSLERLAGRSRTRMGDLSGDYEDLAVSVQGLGYLESGITEPLMRFERALVDFGAGVKDHSASASEGFLEHVHSLLAYSHAFKGVLKLRDQKQLDFEELSAYLSNVATERDRLAGGYGYGMGLGSYFKEKLESIKGGETDMSRAARLQRLDAKIKELQDAVLHAQETSSAFNDAVLVEHAIFRATKRHEMKLLLGAFADGQIRMHKQSIAAWDRTIPPLQRIYVEQ
ncbi:intercellular trafficking and secretion [Rhodotorula kratochvilovae]